MVNEILSSSMMIYCLLVVYFLVHAVHGTQENAVVAPSVVVQLSDLHVSKYQDTLPWGNITGDLRLFRDHVLRRLVPDTILVTGDLTDGKTVQGSGKQHEEEWMTYGNLLDPTKVKCPVLDVRGNHDSFNIYDSVCNYYATYSMSPKRAKGRVSLHALVDGHLYEFDEWLKEEETCPAAVFFGIDASAALGLKSPTNFVALINSQDVSEVTEEAERVRGGLKMKDCQHTSVVSYGHYPLSTFSTFGDSVKSRWYDIGLFGAVRHASGSIYSMDNAMTKLMLSVSHVYVSGHLHAAFGEKLHRVHTFSESYLTELETAAWKDDRRFRILVIEQDAQCLSFEDLYFNTPTSPRMRKDRDGDQRQITQWMDSYMKNGWGVTTVGGGLVDGSITVVTWPRDARYSICPEQVRPSNEIRSLVLLTIADAEISNVTAYIYKDKEAKNLIAYRNMDMVGRTADRLLYRSNPDDLIFPEHRSIMSHIYIQVKVFQGRGGGAHLSSVSQTRTALLHCTDQNSGCTIEPYQGRETLVLSAVEAITLAVNWPNLAHRLYLIIYATILLMLIIPRLLLLTRHGNNMIQLHARIIEDKSIFSQKKILLMPFTSLFILARHPWLWGCILGYLIYLVCGPLYVADLLSGHSLFVVFHHGVIGYINYEWVVVPTPDVLLVQVMHLLVCIGPMLVWIAIVVGQRPVDGQRKPGISSIEGIFLACIIAMNIKVVYIKAYILMGYQCLVVSPGFAWTIPMGLMALHKDILSHGAVHDITKRTKSM